MMGVTRSPYKRGVFATAILGVLLTLVGMVSFRFDVFIAGFALLVLTGLGVVGRPLVPDRYTAEGG